MKLQPYFFFLLVLALPLGSRGQFGLTELFIPLDDTAAHTEIYRTVQRIDAGEMQASIGKELKEMLTVDGFRAIAKRHNFNSDGLIGLRSVVQWDVQNNEAIIAAYAPIFKGLPDTSVFYFLSVDIDVMVSSRVDSLLKEETYAQLLKLANNFDKGEVKAGVTYRTLDMHKFDCFYPARLTYLTDLILLAGANGELPLYDKPFGKQLVAYPVESRSTEYVESPPTGIQYIKKNLFKPGITKTLVVAEQWQDTAVSGHVTIPFYMKSEQKMWAEKQKWDHLRKKIIRLGLILDNNQIVWARFDDIAPLMVYREARMQLFNLFFSSAFCEQIHTEIWRDYQFQY